MMIRTSDRFIVLGLCVVGVSIIGLFALLQHREQREDVEAWSTRQQTSVVTGAIRPAAPAANIEPESVGSGQREETGAGESSSVGMSSPIVGPDAGDELDLSPRKEIPPTSAVEQRAPPSTARRVTKQTAPFDPAIKKQSGRHTESKYSAPQSSEHTASSLDLPISSGPGDAEGGQVGSQSQNSIDASSPAIENSTPLTSQAEGTARPAIESQSGPANPPPITSAQQPPKSRHDVQEELRRARMNGSLPRFGNPDPYGPGGSPSAADR
ncbi:hypothetical protein NOV72_03002 [Caballeronia novacaledonica]|uniref:Uncharacterized protein n=1 Tax=Caballeronia novacaledonica TaxID=1544861 RepID=A0A2U3I6I9_9BURK|nr:hypothetical protein [Caballeronia novacaledonica]SPB15796.1 hypothetical protein NOV72_03002 [Caballeronia novacaledonica]